MRLKAITIAIDFRGRVRGQKSRAVRTRHRRSCSVQSSESYRVGITQVDCEGLHSDDDFEPSERQPQVQFTLSPAARCAGPTDALVRLVTKLLRRQHYTPQTTQRRRDLASSQSPRRIIIAQSSTCRSRKKLTSNFHRSKLFASTADFYTQK